MLLRETIYRELRQAILTCALPPGQALKEQALAAQYGVSRSPVRDSLLRLEQENLVTVLSRVGYVVKSISASDVADMLYLRALIEPTCTAAAAQASDAAVQALNRFRGFAEHAFTAASYADYNEAFHQAVADLSDNKRMGALALDLPQHLRA
jgi:DNA-binding GntR family transcriptional regulator